MSAGQSKVPICGDCRWFQRRLLRAAVLCCLTADALLVAAAIRVLS